MKWSVFAILWCVFLVLVSCRKQEQPNILFILTDDQGAWTLSSQSFPNAFTPELDRLAAEGVVMRNAFAVSAHCGPSRAALISGLYASETGMLGNIGTMGIIGMDTTQMLWPELLQQGGYRTALVGKWHLGGRKGYHPEHRCNDRFCGFFGLG